MLYFPRSALAIAVFVAAGCSGHVPANFQPRQVGRADLSRFNGTFACRADQVYVPDHWPGSADLKEMSLWWVLTADSDRHDEQGYASIDDDQLSNPQLPARWLSVHWRKNDLRQHRADGSWRPIGPEVSKEVCVRIERMSNGQFVAVLLIDGREFERRDLSFDYSQGYLVSPVRSDTGHALLNDYTLHGRAGIGLDQNGDLLAYTSELMAGDILFFPAFDDVGDNLVIKFVRQKGGPTSRPEATPSN